MNLADKLCYPQNSDFEHSNEELDGLTFRERLIIALAGNPEAYSPKIEYKIMEYVISKHEDDVKASYDELVDMFCKRITLKIQADAIIKQLEEGK